MRLLGTSGHEKIVGGLLTITPDGSSGLPIVVFAGRGDVSFECRVAKEWEMSR